ncbi:DUF1868 domain-containing protein [Legionella sp. MW5194]|uniref:DUF1868 domain-containing protein n=1 Tax=Legionella sp. MW5194 TaxID=2662448 RepID=UPI00193D33D0|nr:DUF1868 domain-containing protein [Legionella sp. MW5194]
MPYSTTALIKINADGHYTPFPGVTVICPVREEDTPFWQSVYQALVNDPLLLRYFSPLPMASYHMTAINVFTEANEGAEGWHRFLSEHRPFLQRLKASLDQQCIKPTLTIEKIVVSDVIQLYGHLPATMREVIVTLARDHHLEHKIPHVFHITLAYRYQTPSDERLQTITRHVSHRLQKLLQHHADTWLLKPAGLYCFNDMTAFIPWEEQNT